MKTDVEIAQEAEMRPIQEIAEKLGISDDELELYGKYKAKVALSAWERVKEQPNGKLILVTAINPTPAGEGKTTTSVGLADAFHRQGRKVAVALREPSLGPCFGLKGGAAGGGYAQVVPMEDINLHFTGDFHAITTAHNLLAAVIDNHIQQGNALDIDVRRITWKRVLDLNDRALRHVVIGLGGKAHGTPRETGFDITVASEMMAILCLAKDLEDMKQRLGEIVIGYSREGRAIRAKELNVTGALTLLFKDAIKPNLVQTLEGTPAFIHGGPFANIAHGCNSVMATKFALKFADYVVTEAGFGADLGAEKFLDIKCRFAGLKPDAVVIVATVRALKMHGGLDKKELGKVDMAALEKGIANLTKHIENIQKFGLPAVVAINAFPRTRRKSSTSSRRSATSSAPKSRCRRSGLRAAKAAWSLPTRSSRRQRSRTTSTSSTMSMRASLKRSRRSRRRSTAAMASTSRRLPRNSSRRSRRLASTGCRSAWPRRSIRCRTMRRRSAVRLASASRSRNCALAPAPASSSP